MTLVACSAQKAVEPTQVWQLYTSQLFRKASAYARQLGPWFVLSAKHGLLSPNDCVAPYDETLNAKARQERQAWAKHVAWQFVREMDAANMLGATVVVLAGEAYREHLVPLLERAGFSVEVPMRGFGIGRQLQFLTGVVA